MEKEKLKSMQVGNIMKFHFHFLTYYQACYLGGVWFNRREWNGMKWNLISEGMGFPYSTPSSGIKNPYLQLFLILSDFTGISRKVKTNIKYGFD